MPGLVGGSARRARSFEDEQQLSVRGPPRSIESWLADAGLVEHSAVFAEHEITAEMVPHLDAADLRALGITRIGQQKRLLQPQHATTSESEVRSSDTTAGSSDTTAVRSSDTTAGRGTEPSRWKIMWTAYITGSHITLGDLTRSDVLALNEQVGTCAALIWFADLTYLVGANAIFTPPGYDFPETTWLITPGMHAQAWHLDLTKALWVAAIIPAGGSVVLSVLLNVAIYSVPRVQFESFMQGGGLATQKFAVALFQGAVLMLSSAWPWTFFTSQQWP